MKKVLLLCADDVIRDGDTNYFSIYNLMEELNSIGFPLFLPKFTVFFSLSRDIAEPEVVPGILKIFNNTKELQQFEVVFKFQDKLYARHVFRFNGMTVFEPGFLKLEFSNNGSVLGEYTIPILLVPTQPTENVAT